MSELPSGTVTFLFSDIVGSTALWEQYPETMGAVLARHDALLRVAIERHHGHVFQTVGDAFHAAFTAPLAAVTAAVEAQRAFGAADWGEVGDLRVRLALHTGTATPHHGSYLAPAVMRAARLVRLCQGGQVLLSNATALLVTELLPEAMRLVPLGEHRLGDDARSETLFQVAAPGLVAELPPIVSAAATTTNLPVAPGPLLGRERELATLIEMLARPDTRLLTLTGPGGTGKTRLAIEAARTAADHFPDGVFFVGLAGLEEPALVLPELAHTLGVGDLARAAGADAADGLLQTVTGWLKEKRLLVVLDNFEHLLAAAPMVDRLLAACPKLVVLATSRIALHLRAEREFPVPPLALPERPNLTRPELLMQFGAVALFVERAVAASPGFVLTAENAPAVAAICQRLDGLPLAIELAAARVRLLTPAALLGRLEQRLPLLTGGPRDLPARQQTLLNTIAWSHDLLDAAERRLFRRLAVFAGGWDLDRAEAVAEFGEAVSGETLDLLDSLVAKSLVRAEEGPEGEARFAMLETIREYAAAQLAESGETATLRQRHFDACLALAEAAAPELDRAGQTLWLDRLETELLNLREALAWSLQQPAARHAGLRLAGLLWRFWQVRGHLGEGRRWLEQLLTADDPPSETPERVRALVVAGNLAWRQGDYAWAETLADTALGLARRIGDRWGTAQALHNRGALAWASGDYARARVAMAEGLALERELNNAWGIARALNNLGAVAQGQGDYDRAWTLYEESRSVSRGLGDRRSSAYAVHNLAEIAWLRGDAERARQLYVESLEGRQELGDREGVAECLEGLAAIIGTGADAAPERAVQLLGAADAIRREIGAPMSPANRAIYDDGVEAVRPMLAPAAFEAAWAEGAELSLESAIRLVRCHR